MSLRLTVLPVLAAIALAALPLAAAAQPQTTDLSRLHDALHLTAVQEPAWRAFAAASGPDPAEEARDRSARAMLPNLTAPQRVQLSIDAMRADLTSMERRGDALKAFYATLNADQQAVFDRETRPSPDSDRQ